MFRLRLGLALSTMLLFAGCIAATPAPDRPGQLAGQIWIRPPCPAAQAGGACPDQLGQASLTVLDAQGRPVAQLDSGPDGRFAAALAAGTYTLRPEPLPTQAQAPEQTVTLLAGQVTHVNVTYASGLR